MKFRGKVLMIGFGSVARCTLPVLLRHVKIPYSNITIIDFQDKRRELAPWLAKGVRYFQERITPVNVARTLSRHVSPGGLILDLSWNINCLDMLTWCHDNQVLYVNTSVEEWDPYANIEKATAFEKSLYFKQMEIRKTTARWDKGSVTAVLDHGANPGLISHFTKQGLLDIAQKVLSNGTYAVKRRKSLEKIVRDEKFPELARALGVKTIHISERDT
ncbi:MAG: saccharopine dehydrogenase NADP-binding domain-containing protein, partial [Candidatus Omnitrophota bacterium]